MEKHDKYSVLIIKKKNDYLLNGSKLIYKRALFRLLVLIIIFNLPFFSCFAQPNLVFNPSTLLFTIQNAGTTATKSFTIRNSGNTDALVYIEETNEQLFSNSGFINYFSVRYITISPGQTRAFNVGVIYPSFSKSYQLWVRYKYSSSNNYVEMTAFYTINIKVPESKPLPPTNLSFSNISSNGCKLSWTASPATTGGSIGYYIYQNGARLTLPLILTNNYTLTNLSSATTYTFSVSAYNVVGESGKTNTITITTPQPLNIIGDLFALCNGVNRYFSTTNYPDATYQWSVGEGLSISNSASSSVTVSVSSSYKGYSTISLTRTMLLNGLPDTRVITSTVWVGNEDPIIMGPDILVKGAPSSPEDIFSVGLIYLRPGTSYNWNATGSISPSGSTNSFDFRAYAKSLGAGLVTLTLSSSCGFFSTNKGVMVVHGDPFLPLAIPEATINKSIIYPNPTNGIIYIKLPKSTNEKSLFEIKVFDINGKLLLTKSSIVSNSEQVIGLSQYENGNYIFIISNSDGQVEKQQIYLRK